MFPFASLKSQFNELIMTFPFMKLSIHQFKKIAAVIRRLMTIKLLIRQFIKHMPLIQRHCMLMCEWCTPSTFFLQKQKTEKYPSIYKERKLFLDKSDTKMIIYANNEFIAPKKKNNRHSCNGQCM